MKEGQKARFEGQCRIVARKVQEAELADLWQGLADAIGATRTNGRIRKRVRGRSEEREFANPAELARYRREGRALRANQVYLAAANGRMSASIVRRQSAAVLAPAPDDLVLNVKGPTDESVAGVIAKVQQRARQTVSKGVAGRWQRMTSLLAIAISGAVATEVVTAGTVEDLRWSVVGLGTVFIYILASMIQHSLPANWPGACRLLIEIGQGKAKRGAK